MAYYNGKCQGAFALLDILKQKLTANGWELLRDEIQSFDGLAQNFENCILTTLSGNPKELRDKSLTQKTSEFYVTLPRSRKVNKLFLSSVNMTSKVSIWGLDELKNRTLLIEYSNDSLDIIDDSVDITNNLSFFEYHIKAKNVGELDFGFSDICEYPLIQKLNFRSNGKSGNDDIYINIEAFLYPNDIINFHINTSSSFSAQVHTTSQLNALGGLMYAYEKELEYFININKNRLILAFKIHDQEDAKYKLPLTQIGYFGKAFTYSGSYAFANANLAIFPQNLDQNKRWSDAMASNFEKPLVYVDKIKEFKTNMRDWNEETMNIAPYPNGELFSTNIVIGIMESNYYVLLGECDGIVRILGEGVNTGDSVSLDGHNYVVVANGKETDKYNLYAILKG